MDSGVFADQYSRIIKACLRSGSSIPLDRSGIWDDFSGGVYSRAGEKKKDTSSGPICNGNDMSGAWRKKKTRTVYRTDFDELFPFGF